MLVNMYDTDYLLSAIDSVERAATIPYAITLLTYTHIHNWHSFGLIHTRLPYRTKQNSWHTCSSTNTH